MDCKCHGSGMFRYNNGTEEGQIGPCDECMEGMANAYPVLRDNQLLVVAIVDLAQKRYAEGFLAGRKSMNNSSGERG